MERKKYLKFINEIWPEARIEIEDVKPNQIVCQFNKNVFFAKQLELKLKRLHEHYSTNPEMIEKIKTLSNRNWAGAFSEITTYDYFNLLLPFKCEIEVPVDKDKLLMKGEGIKLDGLLTNYATYFEVKEFSNILPNLIEKLKRELSQDGEYKCYAIDCEYTSSINFESICDDNYKKLKNEVKETIKNKKTFLNSKNCKGLQLKIHYEEQGLRISSWSSSNVYEQAAKLERLPLNKYHQFIEKGSFLKVFVAHNIFNENFTGLNPNIFCRALARRVFCKLTKEENIIDDKSNLLISFVAKKLGGLLFILDNSYQQLSSYDCKKPYSVYESYLYANPNADFDNRLICLKNLCYDFSKLNPYQIDDFEYDNY